MLALAAMASVACLAACSTDGPTGSGSGAATASASSFASNPEVCDLRGGVRSAIRLTVTSVTVDLPAFASVLHAEGWTGRETIDASADLNLPGFVTATSALGDLAILTEDGELWVVSGCELETLGQVHRLDRALAQAWTAAWHTRQPPTPATADSATDQGAVWARPTAIYGDQGSYQRAYLPAQLDLNHAQRGALGLTDTPAAAGFGLYGATDSGGKGDVVGLELLQVAGEDVVSQDKRIVNGAGVIGWDLTGRLTKGETDVEVDAVVLDTSRQWKVGVWRGFFEVLFDAQSAGESTEAVTPTLTLQLQGTVGAEVLRSTPTAALQLPLSVTQLTEPAPT